jgi:hypothetical protein
LRSSTNETVARDLVRHAQGWAAVTDIVLGAEGAERRALPASGLSAEQQVRALAEQATDPNILGRMWLGWMPFV